MKISKKLAIQILNYLQKYPEFYFPFLIVCKEYKSNDNNFRELEPNEWRTINRDKEYKTFELLENLQDLDIETTELMSKGFIEKIINNSLEKHIEQMALNYRNEWKEKLCESEKIEEYGLNEFIGGKADAYEECLYLIRKYKGVSDDKNSIFISDK